ncbi:hypothetical protein V8B97DRAFT_2018355 [Scleroderma yunnanense]
MFVISTPAYNYRDRVAREAYARNQLHGQNVLDILLAHNANDYGERSWQPTARRCPRYTSRNCGYEAADSYSHPAQWVYEDLAARRAREREEALEEAIRERETRMAEWRQYIQQLQRLRRGENAASQAVSTFLHEDYVTSIKSFMQQPEPSPEHQQGSTTVSTSQPTMVNIETADVKGKSKQTEEDTSFMSSTFETESASDAEYTADPHAIQTSLTTVEEIGASLAKLENDFKFPDELDFELSSPNSSELKLSYTSRNAPLRYFDHTLQELLSNLDAVPSYGSKTVRDARKAIVAKVGSALEMLEEQIERKREVALWKMKKVASTATTETELVADKGNDLDTSEETKVDDTAAPDAPQSHSEMQTDDAVDPEMPVDQLDAAAIIEDHVEDDEDRKTGDTVVTEYPSNSVSPSDSLLVTLASDGDSIIVGAEDQVVTTGDEETAQSPPISLTTTLLVPPDSPHPYTDTLESDVVMLSPTPLSSSSSSPQLLSEEPEATPEPELTTAPESPLLDPAISTDTGSSAEESDVDAFLLAQSPMSPPPMNIAHSVDEDGVLVEAPGDEHDGEEGVWVDVEA